jgi:hypothetical protein
MFRDKLISNVRYIEQRKVSFLMTSSANRSIRRRPTETQGRGLEILGHAIEYLIDSYVIHRSANGGRDDMEAAQILMRANMAIFEECEEIVPLMQRLWRRFTRLEAKESLPRGRPPVGGSPYK